jgi:NSS family neurotransmitter:Na+ symporter
MSIAAKTHVSWTSRWTFIMAATGSAVGLGNIWKFPYITGENGGGAFVLMYLLCIAIIGIPVLMAEILLGRHSRSNPINAMSNLARQSDASKAWGLAGVIGVCAGLMIMSFYSVVAGWVLDYVVESAKGSFAGQHPDIIKDYFGSTLLADQKLQLAWHTVFSLLTIMVVAAGVTKGLGAAVRILMPLLFILLLVALGYSYMQGDFTAGLQFLFHFDISGILNRETCNLNNECTTTYPILIAMGHAFFTLSIGMGAIMAYGSYMPKNASIAKTAITVAALDTFVALAAGMAIFPLVFANGIQPDSGPGLMFQSLPIAFSSMPGGTFFGTLFFVLVAIAAWSSSISLIEPAVAWLDENFRINRPVCSAIVGIIIWLGGATCIYKEGAFDTLDYLASNIMLPLGGLLMAIFTGWVMKRKIAKKELSDLSYTQFNLWYAVLRVFTPIGIITVLIIYSMGIIK